jgi:hypothetical protein
MSLETGRAVISELLREMSPAGRLVTFQDGQAGRDYVVQIEVWGGAVTTLHVPKRVVDRARNSREQRLALRDLLQAGLQSLTARRTLERP